MCLKLSYLLLFFSLTKEEDIIQINIYIIRKKGDNSKNLKNLKDARKQEKSHEKQFKDLLSKWGNFEIFEIFEIQIIGCIEQ
jgi:hypothetical protein